MAWPLKLFRAVLYANHFSQDRSHSAVDRLAYICNFFAQCCKNEGAVFLKLKSKISLLKSAEWVRNV